ncbi:universal stress protein [Pseudolysinimonas sp.]|uniref:universal stress protein n=1 Tax=Pseudolysinimonas sp. TaxID=2680009 RepID=UPI003F7FABA0
MRNGRIERIVIGVGGPSTEKAVGWAIERAGRRAAAIELVRGYDPLRTSEKAEGDALEEVRDRIVRRVAETTVSTTLSAMATPDALVRAAARGDLLVVGSRRHRAIRSVLAGSVPLAVASRSSCATIIVPDDAVEHPGGPVVTGVSGDHTGDRAMLFAAREARDLDVELHAVHGWTASQASLEAGLVPPSLAEDRARHRRILDLALVRIEDARPGVRVRAVLDQQPPAWAIADQAEQAQLVVLGSHRWGPLAGIVLGSTAREVLSLTSTPVGIVPPGAGTMG